MKWFLYNSLHIYRELLLKRTFTNDNELGLSPIRQYAHDDVGSFSSMCEEALRKDKKNRCSSAARWLQIDP